MTIALGIDTGGTYTDAALIEHESGRVLFSAKSLTTYDDLSLGITRVVDAVFKRPGTPDPADVRLVGLSTTLATNAIIEGRGASICLVLIGYDPKLIKKYDLQENLVTEDVVYVAGGHDYHGNEAAPLDEKALKAAVLARRERVLSFAVSGFFGIRNPAHEVAARRIIESMTGLPVTCGYELTSLLDSVRRATTVALNARLVPLLKELIETVRNTLREHGIGGQLMVVRGDGSLIDAGWAIRRPIETILSGPAASVVGAWHLAREADGSVVNSSLWVMDMGGTTTDIAFLEEGRPRLSREGTRIGRWRTMVEAVDVHTVGLGGDSQVVVDSQGRLGIGPRRLVPICQLGREYPEIHDELQRQLDGWPRGKEGAQFLIAQRKPKMRLTEGESELLHRLEQGPVSLDTLRDEARSRSTFLSPIEGLEAQRLTARSGFTPTDALHVLDRLRLWDAEASRLGARVLARTVGVKPEEFCRSVVNRVSSLAAKELVTKALIDEGLFPCWSEEPVAELLAQRALTDEPHGELRCSLTLAHPVAVIGAPVAAYLPRAARRLKTRLIIPAHVEVANAVGAVVGAVILRQRVVIAPLPDGDRVRVYLHQGVWDFGDLEEAAEFTRGKVVPELAKEARHAGAVHVEVKVTRQDRHFSVDRSDDGESIYLGSELNFTAVGRPKPTQE